MKYHINNSQEVKPCSAQAVEKCPFYGNYTGTNHYTDIKEAIKTAEAISQEKYGRESLKASPDTINPRTAKKINQIKQELSKHPGYKRLPEVRSVKEMIEKWFNGDKTLYRQFAQVAKSGYKEETTEAVNKMILKGIHLETIQNTADIKDNRDKNTMVTVLDEDLKGLSLDDIKNSSAKLF